ncbi:MAG TPA: fused MFS/spermidine synthase [Candidatus Hypogeohydataceae bacterium YC41]
MPFSRSRYFLLTAIVLIGAQGTIAQVILIRELLVVFYGNELCLGVILGTWLFGVALGAGLGAKVISKYRDKQTIFLFLILTLCLTFPAQVVIIRLLRFIIHVPYGQHISILSLLGSSPLIIMPFSFIIGFIFPFSAHVFKGFTKGAATDIGFMYILESVGSLIGGTVFTFVLAPRVSSFYAMSILNSVVLTNLLLLSMFSEKALRKKVLLGLSGVFLSIVLWLIASRDICSVEDFFVLKRWESFNPGIELVASVDTKYQNIVLGKEAGQYSVYCSGQYVFSFPNPYEYGPIANLVLLEHPAPKKVLLIGGGMGGLLSEMLRYPLEEVHYVELDPKLLGIAKAYLPEKERKALEDPRVKVFYLDGRYFVKKAREKYRYDIIFINMPDPSTASLNRFYTLEFYKEAKALLEPDGVLVTSVSSAVAYIGEMVGNYIGSIYRTLREVFPYVVVTPGQTNYYFASSSPDIVTTDISTLVARYKERTVQSNYFSEHHLFTYLQPGQVRFMERQLQSRKDIPINTDSKPVAYFFNLLLWEQFAGGRLLPVLQSMSRVKLWYFFIAIAAFLFIRLLIVRLFSFTLNRQKRFNCLLAIATTGFAGIVLEIVLIFSFQNIYGYIYERIGLIVALFMMGLAVGGYISNALILKQQRDWSRVLMYIVIGMVSYALLLVPIIKWFPSGLPGSEALFMLLVVIPGLLTGMEFPVASKLYIEEALEMGFTAGVLDSADHAGAFIGAILAGIVLLPVLGVEGTCWVVGAVNGLSFILLLIQTALSSAIVRR